MDPSSLRIGFKLQNMSDNANLYLAAGPHCLIERVRIFCSGTLVEDLGPNYGRTHELFQHRLMPQNHNINQGIMSNTQLMNPAFFETAYNM